MMNLTTAELLHDLLMIPSPSGFEKDIATYIHEYLSQFVDESHMRIDKHNNLIVHFDYGREKTVMIDAHLDEVGFMINNVDRWGSINLKYIGGGCSSLLSGRHLNILTEKEIIPAVVNRKHAHLVYDESDENIYDPSEADVDIGCRDPEYILSKLQIGDPVVYESSFKKLAGASFAGYGFDDKSGCAMLIKSIERLIQNKRKPHVNIVYVFSAQEETGTSKLFPVVHSIKPDLVIEADVTFATDYGHMDGMEAEVGKCELGQGVSLYRGTGLDNECWKLATSIAKNKKIPYQVQATSGNAGYTSMAVSNENDGIKAMVFGIPLRSMHSPTEMINMKDIATGSKLLTLFLQNKKLKDII